jgi:hypothetical protein
MGDPIFLLRELLSEEDKIFHCGDAENAEWGVFSLAAEPAAPALARRDGGKRKVLLIEDLKLKSAFVLSALSPESTKKVYSAISTSLR